MSSVSDPKQVQAALAAPFPADAVEWKPQAISGSRALAVAYIDSRRVMDRLDEVFGLGGWQTSYRELPHGVVCRLRVRVGGEWCEHEDVGGYSEQPDEGDKLKAAYSDSLKRVAVQLGIGRYIFRLPRQWVDYDPQKKQLVKTPILPPWALPKPAPKPKPESNGKLDDKGRALPANGKELLVRLNKHEQQLVTEGRCKAGELVRFVLEAGTKAGQPTDLEQWQGPAMQLAVDQVKAFDTAHRPEAKE